MTAPTHDDLASAHWTALLELDRQPADMRGCYDILAACVRDLRHPPRIETGRLSLHGQARLGYWIELASGLVPEDDQSRRGLHPGWRSLFEHLQKIEREPGHAAPLFRFDTSINPFDDRARRWGLMRGMDRSKLKQIIERGAY